MVVFDILQKLSFSSGEKLLLEEGYVEEKCIKHEDSSCDMLFLYPYCLRDRPCLKIGGMPNGERFFRQSRQIFAGGLTPGKEI